MVEPHLRALVCGYIFKSRSPSCGLRDIPVHDVSKAETRRIVEHNGRGLFADAIIKHAPRLPVADETELNSISQRDTFVQQALNYSQKNRHPLK